MKMNIFIILYLKHESYQFHTSNNEYSIKSYYFQCYKELSFNQCYHDYKQHNLRINKT